MMRIVLSGLAVLGALSFAPGALGAERRVTFADAVTSAARNPRVLGSRDAARSLAEARMASPRLDSNPVVAVAGGPRIAPSAERGFEGAVGVTQAVGLEGSAGRRRDALGAEAEWLTKETDAEHLARCVAAASGWLALWEAQEQVIVVSNDVANEEELLRLMKRLASAQERTQADIATVETRLADTKLRERMAEGALAEARAQMAAEMRTSVGDVLVADGALPEFAAPSGQESKELLLNASALPSVQAKDLLARSELMRAKEEQAARGSRLTLGAEFRHDALAANIVQGTLAVPIPLFAVGAREYATRYASSVRLQGEAVDEQTRARAALSLALHEVEHTGEVFTLLKDTLVPAADRAALLRERQLKVGEGTLLDVIDARRTALEARTRLVRAMRERAWARIYVSLLARATRASS